MGAAEAVVTTRRPQTLSVVIPVYQGERTLSATVHELIEVSAAWKSEELSLAEIVLVHDHGPDGSADVIRRLASESELIRPVWLTRNFGQHAATLAGMASTTQEWVVTMDEDGQHDPRFIPELISTAISKAAPVVYGSPANPPSHGRFRNWASQYAKSSVARLSGIESLAYAESFRLLTGEVARSVAAFAGSGAYLDVAVSWIASSSVTHPTISREDGRASGYRLRSLFSHFWRLVRSSGTRPLRFIAVVGALFAVASIAISLWFGISRLTGADFPEGFATQVVSTLLPSGLVLISLGVIAEYLGSLIQVALGQPSYLVGSDPAEGPLGRSRGA